MNRAAFYTSLRKRDSGVFGTRISTAQVETCEAIKPILHNSRTHRRRMAEPIFARQRKGIYPQSAQAGEQGLQWPIRQSQWDK